VILMRTSACYRLFSWGVRFIFLLLSMAAFPVTASTSGDQKSVEVDFFRGSTYAQRMSRFRNYAVSTQLDLFFYGNQAIHPPATYLASCFAMSGPSGVSVIRERLEGSLTALETRDIAHLLETMQAMGTYDVRDDPGLMALLENSASAVLGEWRETIGGMVVKIRSGEDRARQVPLCGVQE
jgi:hypothetical protein